MEARDRGSRALFASRAFLAFALLAAFVPRAAPAEHTPPGFVKPVDPFLFAAADAALAAAEEALRHPGCDAIFTDFHDPAGSPLTASLEKLGMPADAFLRSLRYVNGEHFPACRPGVLAATRTGSRVVYLCGMRFASAQRTNPRLGAALILHEALHALGLSENPPTSLEITAAVLARCTSTR